MTELTGKVNSKSKELTGAQRLSYGVGHILARNSLGQYRKPEHLQFSILCKLSDYFSQVVVGFDEDKFFIEAGYPKRITQHDL